LLNPATTTAAQQGREERGSLYQDLEKALSQDL